VIFHNEAYEPEKSPEHKTNKNGGIKKSHKTASFLSAVIGAIRSATQSPSPANSNRISSPEGTLLICSFEDPRKFEFKNSTLEIGLRQDYKCSAAYDYVNLPWVETGL